ncbi:MAG: hypothetical protein MR598_02810 [Erysipelotrichaceae bacterium]|nr:hypothetical protein [Erysipelotrichaceae bacterium]
MSDDIEKIVAAAASNVACETGEVPKEILQSIKEQLMEDSKRTDQSFIYGLYLDVVEEEKRGKSHVKR